MSTTCRIALPSELADFYNESGYLPSLPMEYRSNARLRVRSEATVTFVYTPSSLESDENPFKREDGIALIKDLSKTGIGILYHEQIFPEEQIQVHFQGRLIHVNCVRCRRLGARCYEVGGRVLALETLE